MKLTSLESLELREIDFGIACGFGWWSDDVAVTMMRLIRERERERERERKKKETLAIDLSFMVYSHTSFIFDKLKALELC
jgi:hypothetical protein